MVLDGKVAIVTGAASGFGAGIAKRFVEEGARIIVADLNGEGAAKVAAELGETAYAVTADVTRQADTVAMVEAATTRFGRLDIVVNNAGTTHRNQPMLTVDEQSFDRVFNVNVKSIYWMSLACVPALRKTGGGSIVNISSISATRPRGGLVWYAASKGAVNTLTLAMAAELAPDNIRVNAICPVLSPTGLFMEFTGMEDTPDNRAKFLGNIPLGRLSTPADIANACVWLADDRSSLVTGVLLPVDGGRAI